MLFLCNWLIFSVTIFQAVSQSLVAHLRSLRNRLQRYCFFLDWPNFQVTFFNKFYTFFASSWFSALTFSVRFAAVCRSLALSAKSDAKVLLFGELTKYFRKFFISIGILTHQCDKTHLYACIRVYNIYCTRARGK